MHAILLSLLPLLPAALGARIPLEPRQDVSAVASSAASAASASAVVASISSVVGTGSAVVASTRSTATGSASASASASPSANASTPAITVYPYNSPQEGVTIRGQRDAQTGSDRYLGIPFAAPPVKDLRWKPPQLPTWNSSSFSAVQQPPACLQSRNSSLSGGGNVSEDCLYLNVFTPAGANAQTVYLPVLVWVYGGGFTVGTASTYDARLLIATGVATNQPYIVVVPNYRVGVLGFPYGKEAAENKAANLGIRDVQFALEWTRDNIWAWGGDPSRVTVAGQSAGGIIISHLLLQPDIDLFRSAIIQSGGASVSPIGPTESTWQEPFDLFAQAAGCKAAAGAGGGNSTATPSASRPAASGAASASGGGVASSAGSAVSGAASAASAASSVAIAGRQVVSSAASAVSGAEPVTTRSTTISAAPSPSDSVSRSTASGAAAPSASASTPSTPQSVWQCLLTKSGEEILAAQQRVLSSVRYSAGFVFAPSIDGDLIPDSPHALIASGQFKKVPMINGNVKDEGTSFIPRTLAGPSALPLLFGILEPTPPSNTTVARAVQLYPYDRPDLGSPFGTGNQTFGLDPAFKQASAVLGDSTFQASRRWLVRNQAVFAPGQKVWGYLFNQTGQGSPPELGVSHGTDVFYLFGAPRLGLGNYTAADAAVSLQMAIYWGNFVNNQDPNGANVTQWPSYDGGAQNLLRIQANNTAVIKDDYREEQIAFFNSEPQQFNLKRSGIAGAAWSGW